jgi:NADH:ubiquinone oxidoreductase subunit K
MVRRRHSVVLVAVLVAVSVAFFADVLLGGRVLVTCNTYRWLPWARYATPQEAAGETYRTDAARTYLPRRVFAGRSMASGRLPLWNPYMLGGSPFFADPQAGVLYPVNLALLGVDAARAMGIDVAVHFLAAMVGMFLFLGAIRTNAVGRMLGALAYGLSSFFFLRTGHSTFVAAAAWLPYFFFAYEYSKHSVRSGTLLLAVFFSLGYLAGMPQVFMFGVIALLAYALFDSLEAVARGDGRCAMTNGRVILMSASLAFLAVGVQLVPFMEFMRNSRGMGFTLEAMRRDHIWPPVFLLRTVVPDLFGNPVKGTSWIGLVKGAVHPYNSGFMVYCGVAGLALALASLVFLRRSRYVRALFGLLALSLAAGTSVVFLRILYAVFPPATYSQIDRVSVVSCFAIAALAGKGISLAYESEDPAAKKKFVLIPFLLTLATVSGLIFLGLRGTDLISGLSKRVAYLGDEAWFRAGGFRVVEWAGQGGGGWLDYEKRHVGLALVFAGVTALMTWVYVGRRRNPGLARAASWLLVLTLLLDLSLAARRYYVTQPEGCLGRTDGIETLAGMVGEGGQWRIGALGPSDEVLPTNTPEIFGIPAFGGLSALYPSGYVDRIAFAAQLQRTAAPVPPVLGPVGELMCVRYLVTDRAYPELADSPLMRAMLDDVGIRNRLHLAAVGREVRQSLLLGPGEACSLDVYVPQCEYLGFSVGLCGDGAGDGGTQALAVTGVRREGFGTAVAAVPTGEWHESKLDVSGIAGTTALIVFRYTGGASGTGGRVAWSRFEFVKRDCAMRAVEGGYEIDTQGQEGTLALDLESRTAEIPLSIVSCGRREEQVVRLVGTGGDVGSAHVLTQAGNHDERPAVLSDEDFRLVGARLIDTGGAVMGLNLVYDGDMFVYENPKALPKGLCVGRSLFSGYGSQGGVPGLISIGGRIDDLESHISGRASIKEYEDERVVVDVTSREESVLLFQDTLYPGWRGKVDGADTPVARTDLGIRAVPVGPGEHEVVMEYAPAGFRLGLGLSLAGVLVGILYGAKAKRQKT